MQKYFRAFLTVTRPDGSKKKLTFYGKTQKEADEKKLRAKIEYENGILVVNEKTTLGRWYEEWIEVYKKPHVQESTLREIDRYFKNCFLPVLGGTALCDLRSIHIQKCLNSLADKSTSYIKKHYIYINECLKAAPEGSFRYNPMKNVTVPKGKDPGSHRALTDEERRAFLKVLPEHHRGAFFGMMYACGLRPQEVRALSIYNIDFKKERITVNRAIEAQTRRTVKAPKTEAGERVVPIPEWYRPLLESAVAAAKEKGTAVLFPDRNGNAISECTMYRSWGSLLRLMDIEAGAKTYRNRVVAHVIDPELNPYDLRHTYCTILAETGVDIKTAQYLMGHSDIRVTANIYTHVTPKMIASAAEKLNLII